MQATYFYNELTVGERGSSSDLDCLQCCHSAHAGDKRCDLSGLALFSNPDNTRSESDSNNSTLAPVIVCTWAAADFARTELLHTVGGMNNSILISENYLRHTVLFFLLFTRISESEMSICPLLSLSSTIINDSSYFCRLYRHRCKERNKNCRHAEFTPDKQHPRGDLTLQFALTHRGKS